jgi:hypothetical protein
LSKREIKSHILFAPDQESRGVDRGAKGGSRAGLRVVEEAAVVIEGSFKRARFTHSIAVMAEDFWWKRLFLDGRIIEHSGDSAGMIASQEIFREPGKLEREDIPAFQELFGGAEFA